MFSADIVGDPAETSLPELAKWVREIAELFGGIDSLRGAIETLQEEIYAA